MSSTHYVISNWHYSIFRPDRNLKTQCIKFQRNQFVVLECTLRRFLRTLVMIFVSILNYNKVVLRKGSHSQKIFCSLGLDAIVFCFGKQNCCKSLKIYIVFNLRNLNVFVFHVQRKTFFRFYLIFLRILNTTPTPCRRFSKFCLLWGDQKILTGFCNGGL